MLLPLSNFLLCPLDSGQDGLCSLNTSVFSCLWVFAQDFLCLELDCKPYKGRDCVRFGSSLNSQAFNLLNNRQEFPLWRNRITDVSAAVGMQV